MYPSSCLRLALTLKAPSKAPQDASIEEVIDQIRTRDSYIMVRQPEKHRAFADLHRALIDEVAGVLRQRV